MKGVVGGVGRYGLWGEEGGAHLEVDAVERADEGVEDKEDVLVRAEERIVAVQEEGRARAGERVEGGDREVALEHPHHAHKVLVERPHAWRAAADLCKRLIRLPLESEPAAAAEGIGGGSVRVVRWKAVAERAPEGPGAPVGEDRRES